MRIFETDDGWKNQETMFWDFIRSVGMTKQYMLWQKAISKKELIVE
jgi:hypothetical protein